MFGSITVPYVCTMVENPDADDDETAYICLFCDHVGPDENTDRACPKAGAVLQVV